MLTLYVSSDTPIRWDAMTLGEGGAFVNDATVTWALKDAAGAAVSGATGTMSYVALSNGRYDGVLESTVTLIVGATYYLEVTAVSGGANGFRRVECVAQYQDES